jgi:YD repeat-containing protein
VGTSTTTAFIDTDVSSSNTYTYEVQAISAAGILSSSSNGSSTSGGGGSGPPGSSVGPVTYTYDANGHLLKATTNGGGSITYTYDAAGHLIGAQATGP